MKIRIYALAKELGIDSKDLIEFCKSSGVSAKTQLATISPEERDTVVNFIKGQGSGSASPSATAVADAPPVPVREERPEVGGKIRKITAPARKTTSRNSDDDADDRSSVATEERPDDQASPDEEFTSDDSVTEVAAELTADVEPEVEKAEAEAESGVAESVEEVASETATAEETAAGESAPAADVQPAAVESKSEEEVAPAAKTDDASETAAKDKAVAPEAEKPVAHRPEDYISPTGAGTPKMRSMEMRPRGNVSEGRKGKAKDKDKDKDAGKKKPARTGFPFMAAPPPEVNKPQPKRKEKSDAPAQKPLKKLSGDMLRGDGPLREQMMRHIEDRDKPEPSGGGKRPVDLKRNRDREMQEPTRNRLPQKGRRRGRNDGMDDDRRRGGMRNRRSKKRRGPVVFKSEAEVEFPITIRSLSEAMGRPSKDLIGYLFRKGEMATINDLIDEEIAEEIAIELGVELTFKRGRDIEEELAARMEYEADDEADLVERAPIVTILGHVDHGKTTLLDKLRRANVAAGEAGGITQHIASYQVEHNGKKVTFVDTPGHAAFGEMRARGANVTDIIVLVVAADDGVMPQTVECISHAKAAKVPIVVAMNKIDLPEVNEQKVLQDLAQYDVLPAEWGGDVEVVRTSGETGKGLDDLLETILLTAELQELQVDPDRKAIGVCLEAFRDEGRGVVSWLIVQQGTLRIGDVVLCGQAYGKIRAMYNDRGEEITEAGPSQPVKFAGLDIVPGAGDHFFVMDDIEDARMAAEDRRHSGRTEVLASNSGKPKTLEDILSGEASVKDLPLILKADSPGSLEALRGELAKFEHPEVRVELIHQGVGGVNESDVSLAAAAGAIILAFHVVPEDRAALDAERRGVEIRRYDIIYEITEHIKQALEGLLEPERVQETTGRAIVLQTFKVSRVGAIAGCRVLSGTIERNNRMHVVRDQKILGDYDINSLRREKDDVREVRDGMECGIRLQGFNDIKEGDLLEAFRVKEVKRTLDDK